MLILKIGGGRTINLEGIADDLARYPGPSVIVHGANALRDELAQLGSIAREVVDVRARVFERVYRRPDDRCVMMAYAGVRNKRIVELLPASWNQRRRPIRP